MSVKYSYLALVDDHRLVAEWFAEIDEEKTVNDQSDRLLLYFRGMAKAALPVAAEIDQDSTPLVFIVSRNGSEEPCGPIQKFFSVQHH